MKNKKDIEDMKRLGKYFDEYKKCKFCGHSQLVPRNKVICKWCGHYIYKNDFEEFMDKMKTAKKKEKRG